MLAAALRELVSRLFHLDPDDILTLPFGDVSQCDEKVSEHPFACPLDLNRSCYVGFCARTEKNRGFAESFSLAFGCLQEI